MEDPYTPPKTEDVLQAPEGDQFRLASRGARLAGAIIDTIVVGVPAVVIAFAIGLYDDLRVEGTMSLKDQLIGFVLGVGLFIAINGWCMYGRGQTIGKIAAGTRVVTLDGKQIDGNRYLFLRLMPVWIVTQIPIIGGIFGLVDVLLIFRKDKNCLHDDIAKSRVVSVK